MERSHSQNDILVVARGLGPLPREARYAAELARAVGGYVSGLAVVDRADAPAANDGPEAPSPARGRAAAKRATLGERSAFRKLLREQSVAGGDWEVAHGPFGETVAFASHWHDVLVLRAGGAEAELGEILLRARSACLVLPRDHDAPARLDCVVVAYNGSRESIRALHAAIPLLRRARRVVLLRGRRRPSLLSAMTEPPTFDVVGHLERRGIAVERMPLERPDQSSGEEIVEIAERLGADLLVMGAYGRHRLAERVLGGATLHALQHSRVPLLMRH